MDKKFTIKSFQKAKEEKRPISMLTAYDYSMAKILDESGVDSLLVDDSLRMVFQGSDSTISVRSRKTSRLERNCKRDQRNCRKR